MSLPEQPKKFEINKQNETVNKVEFLQKSSFYIEDKSHEESSIDLSEKELLISRVKELADMVESKIILNTNEKLDWYINVYPPMTKESQEREMEQIKSRAKKHAIQIRNPFTFKLREDIDPDIKSLPPEEMIKIREERFFKKGVEEQRCNFKARVNITVKRSGNEEFSKDDSNLRYTNITIFDDAIFVKNEGEMSIEDLATKIAKQLNT